MAPATTATRRVRPAGPLGQIQAWLGSSARPRAAERAVDREPCDRERDVADRAAEPVRPDRAAERKPRLAAAAFERAMERTTNATERALERRAMFRPGRPPPPGGGALADVPRSLNAPARQADRAAGFRGRGVQSLGAALAKAAAARAADDVGARSGARAVNALRTGTEARAARAVSPCSPEAPGRPLVRQATVRARLAAAAAARQAAKDARGRRRASRSNTAITQRGGSPSSRSSSLEEETRERPPAKRARVSLQPAASPPSPQSPVSMVPSSPDDPRGSKESGRKRQDDSSPPPVSRKVKVKASSSSGTAAAAASEDGTFQAAVLERLRSLCGEHEDAKVLAEYIVVMVAGNKGREEMCVELKPFFQDRAQADSFVEWVEETKWKFLTGTRAPERSNGSNPAQGGTAASRTRSQPPQGSPAPQGSHSQIPAQVTQPSKPMLTPAHSVVPIPQGSRARLTPNLDFQTPPPVQPQPVVRPGPHVAITNKCVLQPNPNFDASPPLTPAPRDVPVQPVMRPSPLATQQPTQPLNPSFSKAAASVARVGPHPVRREKNELLESMTKQLQLILTKLSDKGLNDETREKYQAMAQSVQTQMAKISKPQATAPPRRRRM